MNFQSDVINHKLDDVSHMTLDKKILTDEPEAHPNNLWQRLT